MTPEPARQQAVADPTKAIEPVKAASATKMQEMRQVAKEEHKGKTE